MENLKILAIFFLILLSILIILDYTESCIGTRSTRHRVTAATGGRFGSHLIRGITPYYYDNVAMNKDILWNKAIPVIHNPTAKDIPPKFTAIIATTSEEPVCSAAIISLHFVLSTCIRCLQKNGKPVPNDNVRIVVGNLQVGELVGFGIISYEVQNVVLHNRCIHRGEYNSNYDLSLIQTKDEIAYSSTVAPAKIPEKGYQPNYARHWILAAFRSRHKIARTLREAVWFVKVRTVDPETCKLVLNSTFYDKTHNYCTPYYHTLRMRSDICWDDFGAPLSLDNTLIGVLIHKFGCGRAGSAGSFADVVYNSPWIRKTVQKLSKGAESV